MSTEPFSVRLTPDELAKLDEIRGPAVSRSGFIRELLRKAGPMDDQPSYAEALRLLAESARAGKVQAQVALERALRPVTVEEPAGGELERLLRGD